MTQNSELPVHFFDEAVAWAMENNATLLPSSSSALSDILLLNLTAYEKTNVSLPSSNLIRVGNILTLLSDEVNGEVLAYTDTLHMAAAQAVIDFNNRYARYPNTRFGNDCNFYLTLDIGGEYDTFLGMVAQFQEQVLLRKSGKPRPMAILGAVTSPYSAVLAQLGGVSTKLSVEAHDVEGDVLFGETLFYSGVNKEGVPNISPSSSATPLSDSMTYPLFARTTPSNDADARALCIFLNKIGIRFLAIFYVNNDYGVSFFTSVQRYAEEFKIRLEPYTFSTLDGSLLRTVRMLRDSQFRFVFVITNADRLSYIVRSLAEGNVLGNPDFAVIFSDGLDVAIGEDAGLGVQLDREEAEALNRTFVLTVMPPKENFATHVSSLQEFVANPIHLGYLNSERVGRTPLGSSFVPQAVCKAHVCRTFCVSTCIMSLNQKSQQSVVSMFTYDAVLTMGLAMCRMDDFALPTGPDQYNAWLKYDFHGASGRISYKYGNVTGTRDPADVKFQITNILTFPAQNRSTYGVVSLRSMEIDYANKTVEVVHPMVFQSGSTIPPPQLRPVTTTYEVIPLPISVFNLTVSSFATIFSIYCIAWTIVNRKKPQVMAAQPLMLTLLCFGPLLTSIASITRQFQHPTVFNMGIEACMIDPWLISLAFTITFAVLFGKTWRIYRVYSNAQRFRRVEVKAKDVLWPLAILLALDVGLLTAWNIVAPSHWMTEVIHQDGLGRPLLVREGCDTFGLFFSAPNWVMAPLLSSNIFALLLSSYMSWRAKDLPSAFNESYYLALINLILLESYFLGIPILLVVRSSATVAVLVRTLLDLIFSFGVLLPCFVPKFNKADNEKARRMVRNISQSMRERYSNIQLSMFLDRISLGSLRRRLHRSRTSSGTESSQAIEGAPKTSPLR